MKDHHVNTKGTKGETRQAHKECLSFVSFVSFVFLVVLSSCTAASAQTLEPIRYTLSFPAPHTHYVDVEASYPSGGRPSIDLMMAVWTPGSYLIREYARHVEALTAADPARTALPVEKTRKNRWR